MSVVIQKMVDSFSFLFETSKKTFPVLNLLSVLCVYACVCYINKGDEPSWFLLPLAEHVIGETETKLRQL